MGHSQADKLATHQRIVEIAARRFRELGLDGISVADIMKEANLTVGGFYKHFDSRDSLVTEAFVSALHALEPFESALPTAPRKAMKFYLSERHRDRLGTSCPISALPNDIARSKEEVRDIYTARVKQILELIAHSLPAHTAASQRSEAILIYSACVGSLSLSRAVSDAKLSKQILENVLSQVLEFFSSKRTRKK
jgi:TetR/AcrR family transcriptional repressor of nem operon